MHLNWQSVFAWAVFTMECDKNGPEGLCEVAWPCVTLIARHDYIRIFVLELISRKKLHLSYKKIFFGN